MGGGPPFFPQGSSCPAVLWILPGPFRLRLRGFHPLWQAFPKPFPCLRLPLRSPSPRCARTAVWALPLSLAATCGIDLSFSSSGYLDVSVRRVPLHALCIQTWMAGLPPAGFPHSDTSGSQDICSSPELFAAYRVFLRLPVPRHPPCALLRMAFPLLSGAPACLAWPAGGSFFFVASALPLRAAPRMSLASDIQDSF